MNQTLLIHYVCTYVMLGSNNNSIVNPWHNSTVEFFDYYHHRTLYQDLAAWLEESKDRFRKWQLPVALDVKLNCTCWKVRWKKELPVVFIFRDSSGTQKYPYRLPPALEHQ